MTFIIIFGRSILKRKKSAQMFCLSDIRQTDFAILASVKTHSLFQLINRLQINCYFDDDEALRTSLLFDHNAANRRIKLIKSLE